MRKYFLHFFVSGTVLGSLLFNYSENHTPILLLIATLFLFLVMVGIITKKKIFILISISLIISELVLWRGVTSFSEPILPTFVDQKITIVGEISTEPDIRETTTRLLTKMQTLETDRGSKYLNEKMIAVVPQYPEHEIGEVLRLTGTVKVPENFENENGIEFDYENYLAKDKIHSLIYYPRTEILRSASDNFSLSRHIFSVKKAFLEKIQSIIPSPEAELLGGILLGTKRSLGKDLEEKFRRTGLIHIVVLSGYNVTIIAEAIFRFFGFLH